MTEHNMAQRGQIARKVLFVGDPDRAAYIAEVFLEDARQVNDRRHAYVYTGNYRGERISVMAHGMGTGSIGIYAHELFTDYDVEKIIRMGTAGSIDPALELGHAVIAMGACYNTNYVDQFHMCGTYSAIGDFELISALKKQAEATGIKAKVGNVFSSDIYYREYPAEDTDWNKLGVLAVEMETACLFMEAARCKKQAAAILMITGNIVTGEYMDPNRSQECYHDMAIAALEAIKNA